MFKKIQKKLTGQAVGSINSQIPCNVTL